MERKIFDSSIKEVSVITSPDSISEEDFEKTALEPEFEAKTDSLLSAPPAIGSRANPLIKFLRFI
jgi:hypothetical protein